MRAVLIAVLGYVGWRKLRALHDEFMDMRDEVIGSGGWAS